jgi:2-dehydro-3-deoxyphosphogluconate aldolase / (4S)-4-hydroxy-2-oxoglutarate aldolase
MAIQTAVSLPLLARFQNEKLIGIVRTDSAESAIWTSSTLIEAGFSIIEIPLTVPDGTAVIETLSERFPNAIIGAGTVLEAKDALNALGAGAQFLVSPVLVEPLVQFGQEQGILTLPGCMTPTEMYKAWTLGAPAVKFFPAEAAGGAGFVSSVKAPLPQIPIVPTGGIQISHVPGYLKAGALAVGIGAPLIPKNLIAERNEIELKALAQAYLQTRNSVLSQQTKH